MLRNSNSFDVYTAFGNEIDAYFNIFMPLVDYVKNR
jgi:hypothetical protein